MVHTLQIRNQAIHLVPPREQAHVNLLRKFEEYVASITSLPRIQSERYQVSLDDSDVDASTLTYRSLLTKLPGGGSELKSVYGTINSVVVALKDYLKVWLQYQALWDMQPDAIHSLLGDDLAQWLSMLAEVKRSRSTFDTSESSKSFGPILINYSQVQSKVNLKYDALQADLVSKFGAKLGSVSQEFFRTIRQARQDLEGHSVDTTSTSEAVEFITLLQDLKSKVKQWTADVQVYENGQKVLERQRFAFPADWLYSDNIISEWEAFNDILHRKDSAMQAQISILQMKVVEEDKLIEKKIVEIIADFDKNKPVGSDTTPEQAINTLSIFETRLLRVKDEFDSITQAKVALDLDVKPDDRLSTRLEELRDLKSSWSELSKIWVVINELKATPWSAVNPRKVRSVLDESIINQMKALPARVRSYSSYEFTMNLAKNFVKMNAHVMSLKSEALKERHWKTLMRSLNVNWSLSELTLGQVWAVDLNKNENAIKDVMIAAQVWLSVCFLSFIHRILGRNGP
jgi:dynein heavy chain 1